MFVRRDNASLTLANIPTDLIRRIMCITEQPIDKLRLISPFWCSMVDDYLSNRRNHPPLYIVKFQHAGSVQEAKVKLNVQAEEDMQYQTTVNRGIFQGWAAMKSDGAFQSVKVNFDSPVLDLRTMRYQHTNWLRKAIGWILSNPEINRKRLSAIFSRCRFIKCLALYINRESLSIVREMLETVHVEKLLIAKKTFNEDMRIYVIDFDETNLREFLIDAAGTTMEIWEYSEKMTADNIFGRPKDFWDDIGNEMSCKSFTFKIADEISIILPCSSPGIMRSLSLLLTIATGVYTGPIPFDPEFYRHVAFPPFDPRPISESKVLEDGSSVYRVAVITDLDKDSKTEDGKKWHSYFRRGRLTVSSQFTRVSVDWDESKDDVSLFSQVSSGGRAMELSDLVVFDGNLLTVDDRTGILYKINDISNSSSEEHLIPWVILSDGPGNVSKSFKGEWMTVKGGHLYVGGMGNEWVNLAGEYVNDHPMWVKRVDPWGRVEHLQWAEKYKEIRRSMGIDWPGYMVHEAVQWSAVHKKWFFLPRRVSHTAYSEAADEARGSNVMVVVDEFFRGTPQVTRIGTNDEPSTRGFSAFQFVPNTNDELIIALKSEEKDGHPVGSYVTVFHISGRILLHEQQLQGAYKFEGLAII